MNKIFIHIKFNMKIVILAGGCGTRLWPLSRKKDPKQIKSLLGKNTLLQQTHRRIRQGFKESDIFISINQRQLSTVQKQLPRVKLPQIICEPVGKDTAAAIGLAAVLIAKKYPQEILAIVNSDHYIKDEQEFNRVIKLAGQVARDYQDKIVLVGLNPTYLETGYGYIKLGKQMLGHNGDKVYQVDCFKEKPNLTLAKRYLKNWAYLWNPAYFVFRPEAMLLLFKKYLPGQYKILMKIKRSPLKLRQEYGKIKPISIDYGIMEKTKDLLCLPAAFEWADIGHWSKVHDILAEGKKANVVRGKYIHVDGEGNLIYSYSNKLVATVGIKNSIIIETENAILVCPKSRAQEVKKIVEQLEKKKLNQYL